MCSTSRNEFDLEECVTGAVTEDPKTEKKPKGRPKGKAKAKALLSFF